MADTDCIDWRIIETLIDQLSMCTSDNGYNTDIQEVQLVGRKFNGNSGDRKLVVIPNETDPGIEYTFKEDVLPFLLVYTDGETQTGETSYIERYKNTQADITKCLMSNITLNNLCQCISMKSYGYSVLVDDEYIEEICYIYFDVERTIQKNDPYKLM